MVNANELIDALDVAEIIGVSDPKNVLSYQSQYPDMPKPIVALGRGRARLWKRSAIEQWQKMRRKRR